MTQHRQQRTKPNKKKANEATVYRAAIARSAVSGIFRAVTAWILEH